MRILGVKRLLAAYVYLILCWCKPAEAAQEEVADPRRRPRHLWQTGPGRTATTFQHITACLIQVILHPKKKVVCRYSDALPNKEQMQAGAEKRLDVVKIHASMEQAAKHVEAIRQGETPLESENFWILTTAKTSEYASPMQHTEAWALKYHLPVKYVQAMSVLERRGYFIVYDYQDIFGLTDQEIRSLVNFMRYWHVLRQCCGFQMSEDWRAMLQRRPNYKPHWDVEASAYPACEVYDLNQIQSSLMRLPLFWAVTEASLPAINKESFGIEGGKYLNCSRANTWLSKHPKVGFNGAMPPDVFDHLDPIRKRFKGKHLNEETALDSSMPDEGSTTSTTTTQRFASLGPSSTTTAVPSIALRSGHTACSGLVSTGGAMSEQSVSELSKSLVLVSAISFGMGMFVQRRCLCRGG
eukprot:TRINITY_DN35299_c0_g1_i1.p1 TRINITY_DN35299_c0_g1~~TRINITY_DN35299_c0_g1_i1.p1  ORF type:complete len:411 (-),score=61.58 TRINITY_DN35299_c0_g1_i1:59-1291(-)